MNCVETFTVCRVGSTFCCTSSSSSIKPPPARVLPGHQTRLLDPTNFRVDRGFVVGAVGGGVVAFDATTNAIKTFCVWVTLRMVSPHDLVHPAEGRWAPPRPCTLHRPNVSPQGAQGRWCIADGVIPRGQAACLEEEDCSTRHRVSTPLPRAGAGLGTPAPPYPTLLGLPDPLFSAQ